MRFPVAFLLVTASCLGTAAQSAPQTTSAPKPSGGTWFGNDGGSEFAAGVIKTEEEWTSVWRRLNKEVPKPLGAEMAVVIELGERTTGGYRPAVVAASERDGRLVVEYTDGAPGSDTIVTQALTRPWIITLLPRSDLPTEFRRVVR